MQRVAEQLTRICHLYKLSKVHNSDPVVGKYHPDHTNTDSCDHMETYRFHGKLCHSFSPFLLSFFAQKRGDADLFLCNMLCYEHIVPISIPSVKTPIVSSEWIFYIYFWMKINFFDRSSKIISFSPKNPLILFRIWFLGNLPVTFFILSGIVFSVRWSPSYCKVSSPGCPLLIFLKRIKVHHPLSVFLLRTASVLRSAS